MMRSGMGLLALAAFFIFGFYVSFATKEFPFEPTEFDGQVARRDPAAIKKVFDFSHLDGSALSYATKNRLLSGAKVVSANNTVGLELGHFVIRAEDGSKVFACDRYNHVTMVFQGDGSAVAGQSPVMEVEGDCSLSGDINSIAALMIPVQKVLGEPVSDGDFNFKETHNLRIRFGNVADQWPTVWKLVGIKLFNDEAPDAGVAVTPDEIDQYHHKPVILDFNNR
jgi:hypothetical protein